MPDAVANSGSPITADAPVREPVCSMASELMGRLFPGLVLMAVLAAGSSVAVSAQPVGTTFGIGGMVGRTAGITAKLYIPETAATGEFSLVRAIDMSLAWTSDDLALWSVHALSMREIPNSPLKIFLGPGAALALSDGNLSWGLSSNLGLQFEKHRFEVFLQISPRLLIVPKMVGEFGSAVGLRYYL